MTIVDIALFVEIYESDAVRGASPRVGGLFGVAPVYLIAVRQSLKYSNTTLKYLNTTLKYLNTTLKYLNTTLKYLNTTLKYLNTTLKYL
ncbi:hypothetical protein, partial [Nostoc favosum]